MLFLLSLCFGLLLSGVTWSFYQVWSSVPSEDRSLLDKPAWGFLAVWPVIRLVAFYIEKFTTDKYYAKTELRLRHAGVQYSLNPLQFLAAKVVAAVVFLLLYLLAILLLQSTVNLLLPLFIGGGFYYPELWLRETIRRRQIELFRALPFYLDIITLSVEAGSNLTGGLTQAVQKSSDGPLRSEWNRVLRDIKSGRTRADALHDMSDRTGSPAVRSVITSIIQAEKTGSSLGPVLRAQSDQLRTNRFLKAEKLAMEAPVKLLGPLVAFIFPTTFLVLGFVILSKAIAANIITWEPLLWAYNWPGI